MAYRAAVITVSDYAGDLHLNRTSYTPDEETTAILRTSVLRGNDNDMKTSTYKNPYSLGSKDGKCFFLPHTALSIPSERAFTTMTSAVDALSVVFDSPVSDEVYDLQGRRVSTLKKGVYIQNGRKVVRK